MNCEGDEGPAVMMFGGIPAFGGHSLGGSIERSATLTAKDTRLDIESETFFVQPDRDVAGTLRSTDGGADVDHGMANHLVAGTLQSSGKAAGSATQQDAEAGLLVVHGTQDPDVLQNKAHPIGRNHGQENAILAFSCKDHGADAGLLSPTLRAMNHSASHANAGGQVAVCITGEVTHTLKAEGFDGSEDGTGRGQPIVAAFAENSRAEVRLEGGDGSIAGSLGGGGGKPGQVMPCIAYSTKLHNTSSNQAGKLYEEYTVSLDASSPPPALLQPTQVRRLTPVECERLQGFPDNYTLIPWRGKPAAECPDGPRYKAIGNSKAITVVRWLGLRLLQQL
jgi:DNA (cytosine-5)-methyltransferase 1